MAHELQSPDLPFGTSQLINKMLADPRCTSDHLLITADGLDQMVKETPLQLRTLAAMRESAAFLRRVAPNYAQPRGKPHGDFDGSLSP